MPGFGPGPGPRPGGFGPGHFGPPPHRGFGPPPFFGWRRPYYGPRLGCGCLPWLLIVITAVSVLGSLFLRF